jgi:hypothetical protein
LQRKRLLVASASDGLISRLACVVIEAGEAGVVAHITMIIRDFKSSENMEKENAVFFASMLVMV